LLDWFREVEEMSPQIVLECLCVVDVFKEDVDLSRGWVYLSFIFETVGYSDDVGVVHFAQDLHFAENSFPFAALD
jgi:hypothetical protein